MLRLENIVKEYKVADQVIPALKGLTLAFRKSEFVSILGPSGCGKTTTLNIIGGLDKYTSGDLFINGVSTKEFKDRDWDVYRNHRVGFIFQAYNLIPHQTVLENVELALTIAGIDKETRIAKAKKALDEVGLSGMYNKRPNQLSGGQCQRVAIARALVNDPEILLADEPTGALDTQTSIQIMDLVKKISNDRLVIMVTHNPELAMQYSTRIVKLLDGELLDDSNPFTLEDEKNEVAKDRTAAEMSIEKDEVTSDVVADSIPQEAVEDEQYVNLAEVQPKKAKNKENAKMSMLQAFKLSARNLRSKFKRTLMVALAGCIGIVGVSTVLSVSQGVHDYINHMENDMISGNPIEIGESGLDYAALMNSSSTMKKAEAIKAGDKEIRVNSIIQYLVDHKADIENMFISQELTPEYVQYLKDMPKEYYSAMSFDYGIDISNNLYTDFKVTDTNMSQLPAGYDNVHTYSISAIKNVYTSLLRQTDYKDYASIITGLGRPISQEIDNYDYILDQYDLVDGTTPKAKNEILLVVDENGQLSDLTLAQLGFYTQEEFFNLIYSKTEEGFDETKNPYKKVFTYDEIKNKSIYWVPNNLVFSKSGSTYTYSPAMPSGDGIIELKVSGIIKEKKNVSYGTLSSGFYYTTALTKHILEDSATSDIVTDIKAKPEDSQYMSNVLGYYEFVYKNYNETEYKKFDYTSSTADETYGVMMLGSADFNIADLLTGDIGSLMASMTPKLRAREIGGMSTPSSIAIYSVDFSVKDSVTNYLDKWNNKNIDITLSTGQVVAAADRSTIKYQDTVGLIMNMINAMVDMVTIALVAFTALSLVVSTVMVGIITYVSVVERTKEIGVIRSLGGRKKDVSHLFNAETFIIGASSGILGILITACISGILNIIVVHAAGFKICHLTIGVSITMILLSILLTLISGIIPSRAAAKQDPVNALRSE